MPLLDMSEHGLIGGTSLPESAQARWAGVVDANLAQLEEILTNFDTKLENIHSSNELTRKGIHARTREAAATAASAVDDELESRRRSVDQAITRGEKELPNRIDGGLSDAALQLQSQRVVDHLAGLDDLIAKQELERAAGEQDAQVFASLGAAPAMIRRTIVDDDRWDELRREYFQATAPRDFATIDDARQALDLILYNVKVAQDAIGPTKRFEEQVPAASS